MGCIYYTQFYTRSIFELKSWLKVELRNQFQLKTEVYVKLCVTTNVQQVIP